MDLNDAPEQAEYRAQVRAWFDEHKDEAPVLTGDDEAREVAAQRAWQRRLAEAGLVGVAWPKEYGGQGRGPLEHVIVGQEIQRAGVPGIFDLVGVGMLGPTIIAHGSEEQKQRFLGPMLHADEVWCQLFSEPAAGSDLAAVQTRAVQEEGGWRITGQKVWTTNAQHAAYGLMLARTDSQVTKHKGLTMFIVPMDAPGIEIRPLRQIGGDADFNEVFLTDVWLEPESECGPIAGGWGVALTTLMFERITLGSALESGRFKPATIAAAIAADPNAVRSSDVRRKLGRITAEMLSLRYSNFRLLTGLKSGRIPGPEAGLMKITAVNAGIEAGDLITDVIGPSTLSGPIEHLVSFMPGLKTAGGTDEILRNTIGERVIGLPPEPRLDKGIPFSELRAQEREAQERDAQSAQATAR